MRGFVKESRKEIVIEILSYINNNHNKIFAYHEAFASPYRSFIFGCQLLTCHQ